HRGRSAAPAVAVLVVLIVLGAVGLQNLRRDDPSDSGRLTLAVLPLRQIDESTGAVAADGLGLAYMITGELARNPDLRVVSTLVTGDLRAKGMSLREIGKSTGVHYLVDGSVERLGDRLGLELQVVDTRSGQVAWSGRFEPTAEEWPGVTQLLIARIGGS